MHYLHKIASATALLLMVNTYYVFADIGSSAGGGNHKLDTNADAKISIQEALAATMSLKLFESADANHDGYLNATELTYALSVKQPVSASSGKADDSVVTIKVKTALLQNSILKNLHINVETANGIVQLSGVVSKQNFNLATAQIATAGQIAAGVVGVQHVVNSLVVQS